MRVDRILTRIVPWLVAAGIVYFGYRACDANRYTFDDAFITFRYADNLAHGHGAVYNVGERVEGYTNFAWMVLIAAGIKAGLDPLVLSRWAGVLSQLLMLGVIAWAFSRWLLEARPPRDGTEGRAYLRWARVLLLPILSVLVLPDGFAAMAGSGLESAFVGCLLTLAGVLLGFGDFRRWPATSALALVLTLAVLTRLDCAAACGAAAVALVEGERQAGATLKQGLRVALRCLVPVGVVVLVWMIGRYVYYGELLPNTYYAKAANHLHIQEGVSYVAAFCGSHPQSIPLAVLALGAPFADRPLTRRLGLFALLALAAELLFTIKVGGDFMEYRFAWQQYGLLVLAAGAGLTAIADRGLFPALAVAAAVLAVSGGPVELDRKFAMQSLKEMNDYARVGTEVGQRLGETLPPNTIVATTLAGTIAYFSKLTVIDQWGLNDHFVGHQPWVGPRLVRGHVKFAPLDYIEKRKVNLYIAHPVICSCRTPCRERKPNIFVRLDGDRCMRSWYLTQTPELTAHVCAHRKDFVLNEVKCPRPTPSVAPRPVAPNAPTAAAPTAAAASAPKPVAVAPTPAVPSAPQVVQAKPLAPR